METKKSFRLASKEEEEKFLNDIDNIREPNDNLINAIKKYNAEKEENPREGWEKPLKEMAKNNDDVLDIPDIFEDEIIEE